MSYSENPALSTLGKLRPILRSAAILVVFVLAACGTASQNPSAQNNALDNSPSPLPTPDRGEPDVINLAIQPNPLWNWLKTSGTLERLEQSWNIRILENTLPNHFGVFAGGHADVVIMSAMDVPEIVTQSQRDAVILGKISFDRSFLGVNKHLQARTLEDLGGMRIATYNPVRSTKLWGIIANALHGLDFREGGDFQLIFSDPQNVANLVIRGDVDACICLPDYSASYLASGDLKAIYDERSAAEIYLDEIAESPNATPPLDETFVVDKNWFEQNTRLVDFLLSLWDEALRAWKLEKASIVTNDPIFFSVKSAHEIAWMTDYVTHNDWFVPSVYVGRDEAETNSDIFKRLREAGLLAEDTQNPVFDLSYARELAALECILKPGSCPDGSSGDLDRLTDRSSGAGQNSGE